MSTIDEVRIAEKRVQELLSKLEKIGGNDPDNLTDDLRKATDDYVRAVRELRAS